MAATSSESFDAVAVCSGPFKTPNRAIAGLEQSPDTAFLAIEPQRALYMAAYGMGGTFRWNADGAA